MISIITSPTEIPKKVENSLKVTQLAEKALTNIGGYERIILFLLYSYKNRPLN